LRQLHEQGSPRHKQQGKDGCSVTLPDWTRDSAKAKSALASSDVVHDQASAPVGKKKNKSVERVAKEKIST
jgi:hypothetical protein